jgi:type IV secretion system protein TrbJ
VKKTVVAFAVCLASLASRPARADLFGGDVAVLASILAQLVQTYTQIKQQVDTIKRHSEYWQQTLKNLDPTSFNQVLGLYNQGRYTYDSLVADAQSIGYGLQTLDQNFRRLFPSERDLKNARYSDYDQMYAGWQSELHSSAQVAMRAQANAAQPRENALAAQGLVNASRSAEGQVQQLQAIVQMLAVVQSQLTTLTQTIVS